MKKSLLAKGVLALMMIAGTTSMSAEVTTIGALTNPQPQSSFPLWTYYECSESEMIYSADDLADLQAAPITKLEFAVTGGQDLYTHLSVWVENTNDTSVGTAIASTDNMQLAYDSTLYLKKFENATKTDPGYLAFDFKTPFQYTGGGLRVVIASISSYYCDATFNFVADADKIKSHASVKNGFTLYGYTQAGMKYSTTSTQFPVMRVTTAESTGIAAPEVQESKALKYYNVYGQEVEANTKGLVITSNGKKIFNK